jgi:hypothetical protein
MIMRAVVAIIVCAALAAPGLAAEPGPHAAAPVTPKIMPAPRDGTVIKPAGPIDPGIQAKTPSAAHFPTPVIRPGGPAERQPR